ncbi:ATP-dependent DNA ligase [Sinomonas sp. JGH33]|uniref:ATP-dependent DNA ligase n=1 Tax=Sinomonas terricola TaxID=3110330 RepID=A0ABU5TAT1_9MICC|nr:ATP-dependent DNA ligase [Sinomonas sp. JGH33]MEA5456797.1 ATP-dependent DNA ligase [Sinomonas sp. JGH33]
MPAGSAEVLGGAFDLGLAKAVHGIPEGPGLLYEAKVDGFRVSISVAHGAVRIRSRTGTDLTARFPELAEAAAAQIPDSTVVDGEAVIWNRGRLDFDSLQRRLGVGPALARQRARQRPASFVAFDVLAILGRDVRPMALKDRRALLEELAEGFAPPLQLSPATTDVDVARAWWAGLAGAKVEGIMAKRLDEPYYGGERRWMKSKRLEAEDAVVAAVIGSRARPSQLVLGIFDDAGRLRFAGRTGPLSAAQAARVAPFLRRPAREHPWPEEVPSTLIDRFARERTLVHLTLVEPVVVEVSADSARSGIAFRHVVRLIRARPELDPAEVRID